MRFKTTNSPEQLGVEDQDLNVKFCFAKQTTDELFENMTYWSECRDFMGDAVCGMHDMENKRIYGFTYDPTDKPLETIYTCIGMRFPDTATRNLFITQLPILVDFLKKFDLPYGFLHYKCVGSSLTLVLTADPFWQATTFNISFITFLLKSICWELPNDGRDLLDKIHATVCVDYWKNINLTKEAKYLEHGVKKALPKVLTNLVELTEKHKYPHGYNEDVPVHTAHNNSGFHYNCRWKFDTTVIGKWLQENS